MKDLDRKHPDNSDPYPNPDLYQFLHQVGSGSLMIRQLGSGSEAIFPDPYPDPTWRVIKDLDPTLRVIQIRIWIWIITDIQCKAHKLKNFISNVLLNFVFKVKMYTKSLFVV